MVQKLTPLDQRLSARRTRLADAVVARLEAERLAAVTAYTVFLALRAVLRDDDRPRLYLRSGNQPVPYLSRVIANLVDTGGLLRDRDYTRGVYRVSSLGEVSAEEVCALVNPLGYVSHLSAMQRWGITDRRPEALHLTMPSAAVARSLVQDRMALDYGRRFDEIPADEAVKLVLIDHPPIVRGRNLAIGHTKHPGQWVQISGEHVRLATIGQTFLDMIETPQQCGGMAHVVEAWRQRAPDFLSDIVAAIESHGTPIAKVRGGYLLDEMLGLGEDLRIQGWQRFAQRGGSRVLDPAKDFSPEHSTKWMLSLNV
ncbi:MAG TPA: hypothetical protein VKS60_07440 [Stellaceae bacterium]|nr:hypothetical protein [Stellaceae bacterium]